MSEKSKILLAPLDWGLGHATRCLVLIKNLQMLNCDITIAASGQIKSLLQNEFPDLKFLDLPGYQIAYSNSKRMLPLKILIQIPKILKIIRFENNWLNEIVKKHNFNAVISDNRYGLFSNTIPSVFITHQLFIETNSSWLDTLLQNINYRYINRFTECWIPDFKENLNIAGELSHPQKMPKIPVRYVGPLSRFAKTNGQKIKYTWMAVISGPEPQRSIFEKKIFQFAAKTTDAFLIVRGLPSERTNNFQLSNCEVFNHLNTTDMLAGFEASEFIVSRSGYTTVMELLALQKKAVFIPTPGQTEQEYLAQHLSKQKWCYTFNQDDDFKFHLQKAKAFQYSLPQLDMHINKDVLVDFVNSLK